jgi:hypothetical protein
MKFPQGTISLIERILGIGSGARKQLIVGLPGRTIVTSAVVDRNALIARLRRSAATSYHPREPGEIRRV